MQNFIKLLSFKTRQNFTIEIKNVAKIVYFHRKNHFVATLKKKEQFRERNRENMSGASYKQVICSVVFFESLRSGSGTHKWH